MIRRTLTKLPWMKQSNSPIKRVEEPDSDFWELRSWKLKSSNMKSFCQTWKRKTTSNSNQLLLLWHLKIRNQEISFIIILKDPHAVTAAIDAALVALNTIPCCIRTNIWESKTHLHLTILDGKIWTHQCGIDWSEDSFLGSLLLHCGLLQLPSLLLLRMNNRN